MLRIFHNANYDFIKFRNKTAIMTALVIVPGLILIALSGFRYSIEFTGGTLMQVEFAQPPQVSTLRTTVEGAGVRSAELQQFGSPTEFVIRAQGEEDVAEQEAGSERVAAAITQALTAQFGEGAFVVDRVETVGPKVGAELRQRALYAILISFVITLIYLAWRFEWRFGVAAVLATAHDIVATLAFIEYVDMEISLVVVGGILTVVGYSLNDTIIIFDRVRENLHRHPKMALYDILNRSVNETLPRSVLTHSTTTMTLVALALLAGPVIRPFALVMLFGVFVGTFSSIYVASPLLLWIERKWPRQVGDRKGVVSRTRVATDESVARKRKDEPVPTR